MPTCKLTGGSDHYFIAGHVKYDHPYIEFDCVKVSYVVVNNPLYAGPVPIVKASPPVVCSKSLVPVDADLVILPAEYSQCKFK